MEEMEDLPITDLIDKMPLEVSLDRTPSMQHFVEFLEEKIIDSDAAKEIAISILPVRNYPGAEVYDPNIQKFLILLAQINVLNNISTPVKMRVQDGAILGIRTQALYVNENDMRLDLGSRNLVESTVRFDISNPKKFKLIAKAVMEINKPIITRMAINEYIENVPLGTDLNLFHLSRKNGLTRESTNESYAVAGTRFEILQQLESRFRETEALAEAVHTDSQNLRAQVAGIKEQIEKNFASLRGDDFIESAQNKGYRYGKRFIVKKLDKPKTSVNKLK